MPSLSEKKERGDRYISRILFPAGVTPYGMGSFIWSRCHHRDSSGLPGGMRSGQPPPYLALLQVGLAVLPMSPSGRWSLTPPFHPCLPVNTGIGGLFSVALSLSRPLTTGKVGVTNHPALWSPDFPPLPIRKFGRSDPVPISPFIIYILTIDGFLAMGCGGLLRRWSIRLRFYDSLQKFSKSKII